MKFERGFCCLLVVFAAGVLINLVLTAFGGALVYDEIVVTEISKQPVRLMIETIKAEPHPRVFTFCLNCSLSTALF